MNAHCSCQAKTVDAELHDLPLLHPADLGAALEKSGKGLMFLDAERRVLFVNQSFCEMTGYATDELVGHFPSLLQFIPEQQNFVPHIWQTLHDTGSWHGQVQERHKQGNFFAVQLTIQALRDLRGEISHYLALFAPLNATHLTPQAVHASGMELFLGMPGRLLLNDELHRAMAQANRNGHLVAVVFLDLDGFKTLNDQYGQVTGDQLLARIAQRLRQFTRMGDTLTRIGGDEFALIQVGLTDMDTVREMSERLLSIISAPCDIDGHTFSLTASLGVTVFPSDGSDAETLLRHAEQAMYQAKQAGRNRCHLFDSALDQQLIQRQQLITELARALDHDELVLYFQPKVNMRTGKVIGVEALLRWQHPEKGLLLPGVFLPHIENHDIIVDIGNYVIRKALAQISRWQRQRLNLSVSVNVSARQLQCPKFVESLQLSLSTYPDVSPESLEMEILESAALDNTRHVSQIMEASRELGVSFSLDDFGTGYASLAYLREIPAEVLKIDRSFVNDLLEDSDDLILVEGVIGLAKAFRRVVVAEGVETSEHGLMLMRLGCDIAQGFGIARPMPADKIPEWVANYRPDPLWTLWADIPWEMEDFPLLVAKYDHIGWVKSVLDHLEGDALRFDRAELADHTQCRFGQWYYSQGRVRYGHLPAFIDLETAHQRIHHLAPEIVRLHDAGKRSDALSLAQELVLARDEILKHLDELQRTVVLDPNGRQLLENRHLKPRTDELMRPLTSMAAPPVKRPRQPVILIVDDTPTNIELLAGVLSADYAIKFATHGAKALEILKKAEKPDLILLDVMMPGMDGYEVCRLIKDDPATRHIPVMFITAKNTVEDQAYGFSLGAVDYIAKPFEIPVVTARVRTQINLKLRTDLLETQTAIDALTGISNRRRFDEVLRTEWKRAARNFMPVSLLTFDIDHFKAYNTRYGHGAGDECLRQIGTALTLADLRPGDFVARYGGEEFTVILPGCHSSGAHAIADRIRGIIESLGLEHEDSETAAHVTVSVGCATKKPAQGGDASSLVLAAEQALSHAKQAGRNRVNTAS